MADPGYLWRGAAVSLTLRHEATNLPTGPKPAGPLARWAFLFVR